MSAFPDPVFDALKWRFWEELRIINLPTFTRLSTLDAERSSNLTRASLELLSWEMSDELLEMMLTKERSRDPGYVVDFIASELGKGEVSHYKFFANIAKLSKEPQYVEPLFHALETADNPNVYLRATEALLAYNDGVIRQRILAAPANNKAITEGWGGVEFRKLLNSSHGR